MVHEAELAKQTNSGGRPKPCNRDRLRLSGSDIWDNLATLCLELVYAPRLGRHFVSHSRRPPLPPIFLSLFTPHPLPLRQTERFVLRLVSCSGSATKSLSPSRVRSGDAMSYSHSFARSAYPAPCHRSTFHAHVTNYRPEPVERTTAAAGTAEEEEG